MIVSFKSYLRRVLQEQDEYDRLLPEAEALGIPTRYEREIEPGWTVWVQRSASELRADIQRAANGTV